MTLLLCPSVAILVICGCILCRFHDKASVAIIIPCLLSTMCAALDVLRGMKFRRWFAEVPDRFWALLIGTKGDLFP
jgi:hypothetical protein